MPKKKPLLCPPDNKGEDKGSLCATNLEEVSNDEAKGADGPEYVLNEEATAPWDPRFPNANVTKYCYFMYIDYHRCVTKRTCSGDDLELCDYFKKAYTSLCPNEWVDKWDSQREEKVFPFPFKPPTCG